MRKQWQISIIKSQKKVDNLRYMLFEIIMIDRIKYVGGVLI